MNGQKLSRVFKKVKEVAGLDYAITRPDSYGDCMTCVNYRLCELFGEDSKGIFAKHWMRGINRGRAYKDVKKVYVAHDITEEQFGKIKNVLEENGYVVEPSVYNSGECIGITEG